jgi:hypothetical protein
VSFCWASAKLARARTESCLSMLLDVQINCTRRIDRRRNEVRWMFFQIQRIKRGSRAISTIFHIATDNLFASRSHLPCSSKHIATGSSSPEANRPHSGPISLAHVARLTGRS